MLTDVLIALLTPALSGLAFSFVLEQVHTPRPRLPWQRDPADLLLHSGLWLVLYLLELVQFGRPWLAMGLTCSIFYVLLLVNRAKFDALQEPFLYQDFEYFVAAFKHPRLYLPFFGFFKILVCLSTVGLALWLGIALESALARSFAPEQVWLAGLVVLLLAAVMLYAAQGHQPLLSFKPNADFKQRGLLALLWHYAWAERHKPVLANLAQHSTLGRVSLASADQTLYDTVVVQSESFFDPRRAFSLIKPGILSEFDRACRASVCFGPLAVTAWGANTVRTEFSFFSGIDSSLLGIDQFNPYRRVVSAGLPSLAREFQKKGYRTVCLHPYPASFYQRDKIFSLLGFDEFIDLKSFTQPEQQLGPGPYVSDQVLTEKILETFARPRQQPLFIFAITMENHGPLHLEHLAKSEEQQWLSEPLPKNCQELSIYLRHLANADQMISQLLQRFSAAPSSARPIQLLWYGDHVPVLAKVYAQLGLPDGHTEYFLWRSDECRRLAAVRSSVDTVTRQTPAPQPLGVHQLAAELLR